MINRSHFRRLKNLIATEQRRLAVAYPSVYRRMTTHEITLEVQRLRDFVVPMGGIPTEISIGCPTSGQNVYDSRLGIYISFEYLPGMLHLNRDFPPTPPMNRPHSVRQDPVKRCEG
jgi:hypothetical protein